MIYELKHFTNLVIRLERPDIQTVDSLLIHMVGDRVAGTMLKTLLYWMPKSVRHDGMVYKSWRHWMAECALSIAQIKRVHHHRLLEAFGIERRLKKAEGSPTTHYALNFDALVNRLAEFLSLTAELIRSMMVSDVEAPPKQRKHGVPKPKPAPPDTGDSSIDEEEEPPLRMPSEPPPVVDDSPKLGTFSAKEVWQVVKDQLELMLDRGSYETWVKRVEYLDYNTTSDTLTLLAPNSYIADTLMTRFYPRLLRTCRDITMRDCNIEVVSPEK